MAESLASTDMCSHDRDDDDHREVQGKKRRKLDTVKCDRCRSDRQKCGPAERVWPEKCSRCLSKELPCSEGRRAERISKRVSTKLPSNSCSEPSSSKDAEERFHQWSFLSRYHKNLSLLFDRLESLQQTMVSPFGIHDPWKYNCSSECNLLSRYIKKDIEPMLSNLTAGLLAIHSRLPSIPGSAFPALVQTQKQDMKHLVCPICHESSVDRVLLQMFRKADDVIGEFLSRQDRLLKHCKLENDVHTGQQRVELVASEVKHYWTGCIAVTEQACTALLKLGLHEVVHMPGKVGLYHPEAFTSLLFFVKDQPPVSLGQNIIHQWLDHSIEEPTEYHLTCLLLRHPRTNINHQDVLGRAPLHIACHKGWTMTVDWLLQNGALPGLVTVFDSLPLHYSASIGDHDSCEKLLEQHVKFPVNKKDCQEHTPLHYAKVNDHTEVVKLLSSHLSCEPDTRNCNGISGSPNAFVDSMDNFLSGDGLDPSANLDWYLAMLESHVPET